MSPEREKEKKIEKRTRKWLSGVSEQWPALTAAAVTFAGAGGLFLFLRRRTRERKAIDQIVERVLSDPEEIKTLSKNLGNLSILRIAHQIADEIDLLDEPERGKILKTLKEASVLAKAPPGATSTPESQFASTASIIASEIQVFLERQKDSPTRQSQPQDN